MKNNPVRNSLVIFLFALSCCTVPLLLPTENDVAIAKTKWEEIDLNDLQTGHLLYQKKCSGCHYLYRPNAFTVEKWEKQLPEMKNKAKLDDEQFGHIRRYLLTMCEAQPAK